MLALSKSEMEEKPIQPAATVREPSIPSTPPVSSSTPIQVQPTPPKKSKLLLVIIGIILFLLIAGSIAGFYIFKQQSSKTFAKPTPVPVVQKQIPNPTTTIESTANWKTYENTLYNYSFSYPSNYKTGNGALDGPTNGTEKSLLVVTPYFGLPLFYVNTYDLNNLSDSQPDYNKVDIEKLLQTKIGETFDTRSSILTRLPNIKIGDKTYMVFESNGDVLSKTRHDRRLVLKNNNLVIVLGTYYENKNDATYKDVDQILSTFKFTDSQTTTPSPTISNSQTTCTSNVDCPSGSTCITVGPIIPNQPLEKVCSKEGEAVPL
ncbi:MAG: hypothetical protein CO136_00530 [Candidatus Levybacteria bacterium CG_4_9_14_3_um_filter_36_7]|nr:MAG: hypothetical protein CO136_00530 [Candidatus Levybacteria bacterium CG_4_9_14_3_um_filter_36_7]